ncbi:MAG: hypothetical protein KC933_41170, partial [Myxococcales bacterium]|nr:hypothetical protein [Myxococcales bacterium]
AVADVGDDEAPSGAPLVPLGQPAVDLALGEDHACALLADGTVRCWGDNRLGQLGLGVGAEARRGDVPAAVTFDLFCPSRED